MNCPTKTFATASIVLTCLVFTNVLAQEGARRPFQPEDIHRLSSVGDIAASPDGQWVAYSVGTTNVDKDSRGSDLFMVSWDGSTRIQLTHTEDSGEGNPRFSPDGRYLAFIAARSDGNSEQPEDPKGKSQVWLLNRSGGEAERITAMPGGVSSFEWSPDSSRLVLVSRDAKDDEKEGAEEEKPSHDTPKPIVVDRYQFKRDGRDWIGHQYQRLYLFDVESRQSELLTPGRFDSTQPSWGPEGRVIAFTSKRAGDDPDRHDNSDIYLINAASGAEPRQVTTWLGSDSNPAISPDGQSIVYLQSGELKYAGYDPSRIAVISVNGGEPTLPARDLDRHVYSPQWSLHGRSILFLIADDRIRSVGRMSARGGAVERTYPAANDPGVVRSFVVGKKGIATVTSFGQKPAEIYRADNGRALTDHNRAFLETVDLATVEGFDSKGVDGVLVGSMLLKPPGYRAGVKYPTIAYVHGGPVGQDGYEFDSTSQALAAQGYLVVNPNYRGSTGHGRDFSRAIYADWGNLEIVDIHTVMDNLVAQGLADPERLGIGGWSYGGINTNYAIATDTRFAAAVSGAAASNYLASYGTDQYIRQYESEIGLPWESAEPYLKMSYPFLHADRIKTPTMFMCGEMDFNVPLINSEQMYQALRSLNVPTQLVIYPGQNHGLAKPSYNQDRLERMLDWYGRYMEPNN